MFGSIHHNFIYIIYAISTGLRTELLEILCVFPLSSELRNFISELLLKSKLMSARKLQFPVTWP